MERYIADLGRRHWVVDKNKTPYTKGVLLVPAWYEPVGVIDLPATEAQSRLLMHVRNRPTH